MDVDPPVEVLLGGEELPEELVEDGELLGGAEVVGGEGGGRGGAISAREVFE